MASPELTKVEQLLAEDQRTISWLARKVGVHPTYAWKMIRGLRPLTKAFRDEAAAALGQDPDDLFADIDAKAAS